MKGLLPLAVIFLFVANVQSQCIIQAASLKICIGSTTSFSASPLTPNDSLYVWNFGDNGSSNQVSPTYQYASTGSYVVTMRKYFFGGTFCDATPVTVKVFSAPIASYTRISSYIRCFDGNAFSFTDNSQPGASNAPIVQRTIVFDDGSFQQEAPPYSNEFSHSYSNPSGAKYEIVLEVKDTNGCLNQFLDSVVVLPKMNDPGFYATWEEHCGYADAVLKHNGIYHSGNVNRISWLPGNGDTIHSPPFNNFSYRYLVPGIYKPQLIIEDKNGCSINVRTIDSILVVNRPDSTIHFDTLYDGSQILPTQCHNGNYYALYNPTSGYSSAQWFINGAGINDSFPQNGGMYYETTFPLCGSVNVRLEFQYYGCKIVADTVLNIIGPTVFVEKDTMVIRKKEQCEPFDTIYFRLTDPNCYYNNSSIHYLWDFKDAAAPPCIVNTKAGINVGMNCNFSADSLPVNHLYGASSKRCLYPSLFVIDSVSGCWSKDSVELRMTSPKAGPDSSVSPPRRGVYHNQSCNVVSFHFDEMVPFCGPEQVFMLFDSSCFPHVWEAVSSNGSPIFVNHAYNRLCSGDSVFTYGVVARNGHNKYGQFCYDTAWYHGTFKNAKGLLPRYQILQNNTCKPFSVRFSVADSIRPDIKSVSWYFGDNKPNYTINYTGTADSIINSFIYNYEAPGIYIYRFFYTLENGCGDYVQDTLWVGKFSGFEIPDTTICYTDPVEVYGIAYYAGSIENPWSDTARLNANKERIYWDFGDSNVWHKGGSFYSHYYAKPGIYDITAAIMDSTAEGCADTVVHQVYVYGINKNVIAQNDTFFCAPTIVTFIDSSYAVLNDTLYGAQYISSRKWTFNPYKPLSTLQKAVVYYPQNGNYEVKLTIETEMGCTVDTTVNLVILGPSPKFVILPDTFGCAPFTVKLRNETQKQLLNWIWYFNDSAGTVYSTNRDTDITFTYKQPGIYKIDLLGEDRIYNPTTNSYSFCSEKYPFIENPDDVHPLRVTVLKTDTLTIDAPDSVCVDEVFFTSASGTSQISLVKWLWGDGLNESAEHPKSVSHQYDSAIAYLLQVEPVITSPGQCVIGAEKSIRVQTPVADFTFDSAGYPEFNFKNLSTGAIRYLWDFGQPSSPLNTSTEEHASHNYGRENKQFTVCLMAFDGLDCMDSVCKILPLRSLVKIPNVFTPSNADGKNDAFDIEIEGWEKYELIIYNRWGTVVFEGFKDGFDNDGINWNGNDHNTGNPCPEGVYFVIFKYKLFVPPSEEVYHGTVTLIRD